MKDTVKDLKERRSIKKYQDRQIEEEELQAFRRAGMNAPRGRGVRGPAGHGGHTGQRNDFQIVEDECEIPGK